MPHRTEQWTVKSYIIDRSGDRGPQLLTERKYELERGRDGAYRVTETGCQRFMTEQEWSAAMRRIEERGAQLLPDCLTDEMLSAIAPGEYFLDDLLTGGE